ncbi:hypothetical protein [Nocardioides plantarum]|uniref:Uncharacterized protein n=1 Tax=Nocardioides plantarum TaxID=29299 RepID=A0ABV5KB31_9ACTN|nr:hypothetical protein [Nocardioides plantarum]
MPERHPVIRQVYAVGAVLAFVGTFMPLFAVEALGSDYTTRNLWELIGEDGGWAAGVGLLVMLATVATALLATAAERGFAAPSGVLALALVSLLMLVLKPGTPAAPRPRSARAADCCSGRCSCWRWPRSSTCSARRGRTRRTTTRRSACRARWRRP